MQISLVNRFKPYSHIPGTACLIPGTTYGVKVFPIYLVFFDLLSNEIMGHIDLGFKGPVKDFTVQADLERGRIRVWGVSEEGYFRYSLFQSADNVLTLTFEKTPIESPVKLFNLKIVQGDAENLARDLPKKKKLARLSLGNNRSQDWDLIRRRNDIAEILPYWFAVSQWTYYEQKTQESQSSLLKNCQEAVTLHNPEAIKPAFLNLFLGGFSGIFVPQSYDLHHLGFAVPIHDENRNSLILLSEGSNYIEKMFFSTGSDQMNILPCLSPEFHAGRMVDIPFNGGFAHLEWTKKKIHRMMLQTGEIQGITVNFQKIDSYRLRTSEQDRGKRLKNQTELFLEPQKVYFFDRFE